jgi:hypothetical protein
MFTFTASDYKTWESEGLKDFDDFAECVEYVNQSEYGDGQLEGEWYYGDDDTLVIYSGSFGNYNSPGATHFTQAEKFATEEEYKEELAKWEATPEYIDEE